MIAPLNKNALVIITSRVMCDKFRMVCLSTAELEICISCVARFASSDRVVQYVG